jgi:hypothetical protein
MGRPIAPYRDDPDSVSLHTTPDDYAYDDAPEPSALPPSYTDSESSASAIRPPARHIQHVPPPSTNTDHTRPMFKNGKPIVCDTITHMNPILDTDPVVLERAVYGYAGYAPVPLIYIWGTHTETVRKNDKQETKELTDFRIVLNMHRYLHRDFNTQSSTSMAVVTVDDTEKTYRGTSLKCRAPGAKSDIEVGQPPKPSLTEWCHRYCASPRMLRTFRIERTVPGLDEAYLRNRLEGLIRSTNYRGHIAISFPIEDKNVDIYTSNTINRWRLKTWICWIFYLTFLWIFTWPYLFFMTKRYAVVRAEWPFSLPDLNHDGRRIYTTVSEEQWFDRWSLALRRLVLDQYQGEASEDMMDGVIARAEDPRMPGSIGLGHEAVNNAVGILAQGFQIARAVSSGDLNRVGREAQGGWGYDR